MGYFSIRTYLGQLFVVQLDTFQKGKVCCDMELIQAQSPNPDTVFHARFTNGGALWSDVPRADDKNFDRLIRHTVKMAEKQLADIRSGENAVSPASFDKRDGCAFCNYRAACLFDPRLDGTKVRRLKSLKWNEVFEKLALEDDE